MANRIPGINLGGFLPVKKIGKRRDVGGPAAGHGHLHNGISAGRTDLLVAVAYVASVFSQEQRRRLRQPHHLPIGAIRGMLQVLHGIAQAAGYVRFLHDTTFGYRIPIPDQINHQRLLPDPCYDA